MRMEEVFEPYGTELMSFLSEIFPTIRMTEHLDVGSPYLAYTVYQHI